MRHSVLLLKVCAGEKSESCVTAKYVETPTIHKKLKRVYLLNNYFQVVVQRSFAEFLQLERNRISDNCN